MDYTTQDYIEFAERSMGDTQPYLNAQTFAAIAQAKALAAIAESLARLVEHADHEAARRAVGTTTRDEFYG